MSSSKPASRSLTPSNLSRPSQPGQSTSGNADAFSSLLGTAFSNASNGNTLSLAERQAVARKEDEARAARERAQKEKDSAVWSGLDLLGQRSSVLTTAAPSHQSPAVQQDEWTLDSLKPQRVEPESKPQVAPVEDDWGLGDFASSSKPTTPHIGSNPTNSDLLFDAFDESSQNQEQFSGLLARESTGPSPTETYTAEDDILGMLGKPVDAVPRPTPPPVGED